MNVASLTRKAPLGDVAAVASLLAAVVMLVALRTATPFPVANDHAYFLPASFALAQGEHLANPWMPEGFNRALDWHGFLQPWLVGALGHALGGGWHGVYLALDALAALGVVTAGFAAHRLGFGPWRVCGVALLALAVMLDARSRPETLATLETILLVLLVSRPQALASIPTALGCGALLACLLGTHPIVFGMSGLGVALYVGVAWLDGRATPREAGVFALAALAAFAATLPALAAICFDGSLVAWLSGIVRAATTTVNRQDPAGLLRYLGANRFLPGLGLGLLFLPILATTATAHRRWAMALMLLGAALYALLLWRFALRIPQTYYNLTGVLVAGALIAGAATRTGSPARRASDGLLATLAAAGCAGALLWSAQALAEHSLLDKTRATLAETIAADKNAGRRICADAAALPALDDAALAHAVATSIPFGGTPQPPDPKACDVFYQLQSRMDDGAPQALPGFKLEEDATAAQRPFAWIKTRPQHYGFTRWVRAEP